MDQEATGDPRYIFYVCTPLKKSKSYCRESPDLTKILFEEHGAHFDENDWFIHDGGGAFGTKADPLLPSLGYLNHFGMAKATHMYVSVNDNDCHSQGKIPWIHSDHYKKGDALSSLFLKLKLDSTSSDYVKSLFVRTFALDQPRRVRDRMETLVRGHRADFLKQSAYFYRCLYS